MPDVVRGRNRGDSFDPIELDLEHKDGSPVDLTGLTTDKFTVTLKQVEPTVEASFTGSGTVTIPNPPGSDGKIRYQFTIVEVATVRRLQVQVEIDRGAGATDSYPVPSHGRIFVEFEDDLD